MNRHAYHHKYKSRCGTKENRLGPVRKGLLNAALNLWLVNNGHGLCSLSKSSSIAYWPKQRSAT